MADLVGRSSEAAVLEKCLMLARTGRSGSLLVRGEAGIGKTAVLEHTQQAARAAGFRVVTSVGVESESQFAFAGLHQLCGSLLDHRDALPEPLKVALGVVFGLHGGPAPDRFLVGLAVLNLLAEVAEERPLLCLVDDAQWLDESSAQVLAFVARRLGAERLALIVGVRDANGGECPPFTGLPVLRLEGLADDDARELLSVAVHTPLDERVRDRIVAEARGNPLALLELPRSVSPERSAGGFELPHVASVPQRIEETFRSRSDMLPEDTQLLLLVAASDQTGDAALLWRAAASLGLAAEALEPAKLAGLLEIDSRVRFRHPLVRSAVYQAAKPQDLRRAHEALAAVTDPERDPDRRAWHQAQAVLGADEDVALALERSAGRARARGGAAASAAFLERATEVTDAPSDRARRALEAAHAKYEAGVPASALELLAIAAAGPLEPRQRARVELLRAQVAFHLTRAGDVPRMLVKTARTLAPLDASLSRETYLHALEAAIITGGPSARDVAALASDAPSPPGSPVPADQLLAGLVRAYTEGYEPGGPDLRRALEAFREDDPTADTDDGRSGRRWLWLASRTAATLFDDELVDVLTTRNVRLSRQAGALATLPAALASSSIALALFGRLPQAHELATEETEIRLATGAEPLHHHAQLFVAGWQGRRAETVELHDTSVRQLTAQGQAAGLSSAQYALAVLHNGLGDYASALSAAEGACDGDEPSHHYLSLFEVLALAEGVEAATRVGETERALAAAQQFESRARASATAWALGMAARSRALVSTGSVAEGLYREAIEQLGKSRVRSYLARTHLVYGEWLRREGRRRDAREQLRAAHRLLAEMGADAFATRAASELRATGEHPRARTAQPTDELTAQEQHVARLVATGATSREVGAQLFLSPRTIEAHLRSIFRKLGISSRRELRKIYRP
ncbi:ATP-binding protein [Demequina muriae]|uniref:AAA family ATPase n=1 Tax=Demequina muriae TaxID=3051664 RepID=A0ABT8GJM2_9MICO|nr:LuxR family transcriptional regulator [Demequina sp. EGI L300058]MDN4481638.1 AAA family ATPase [Demequina sp. EGI L300058]